nr:nucleotide-binding alpha-beta plait domain-containing protein [Tanacetum cinerariifolium]
MEGGQEGEQGDSEGDDKREDVSSWNVVNFYFTNFPPEWNKVNLHELFAEIGEIAHVYVARKASKSGKRFGFARFFQVGNLQALEKRLNRIKIGSFKLPANIAKYVKNTSKFDQGCKRKGSNHAGDDFDSSRDNVKPTRTALKCETPNEVVQDGSEEEPSYAAGNFPEKDGSVDGGEASPFPVHSHEKDFKF